MKRRPFLKQASAGIASLPIVMNSGAWKMAPDNEWKNALQLLSKQCQIKAVPSLLCFQFMPALPAEVQSGEFKKADNNFYFYNDEQCCFRIFEKTHRDVGVIALLIPCWAKQKDGSWKKVACLSQYDLQALANACAKQPSLNSHDLLPAASDRQQMPGNYYTQNGEVGIRALVAADNAITCKLQVVANDVVVLQSAFAMSAPGMV